MTNSTPPQPPRKHHFLPECYQKLWAGDDHMIERFSPGHDGRIRVKKLFPAGVGWSRDLYRIPGEADDWAAQRVETEFFAKIDTAAAAIMRKMRDSGAPPRTAEERTAWATFVLAFLHRTPEHLNATLAKMVELSAELMPEVEERYADLRGAGDPPTFAMWQAQSAPHATKLSTLRSVMDLISNPNAGPYIVNLEWAVIDLSSADYRLMVGDNPVILVPLKLPDGHLALPLGPDKLFLASEHRHLVNAVVKAPPRRTVRLVNRLMVERATSVVIARDRSQESFVRKHFGTCRIGSLATGLRQPQRV